MDDNKKERLILIMAKEAFIDEKLLKKIMKMKEAGDKKAIKTWSRRSMVIPEMVGMTFAVHNGHKFISVYVSENMVGHRLGEFAPTRVFKSHGAHTERSASLT